MAITEDGTSGVSGALLLNEEPDTPVTQKLDKSLPQIDINLVSDNVAGENDSQPMNDELREALENGARTQHGRRSRPGRRRVEPEPIEIDPEYLHHPQKMNYALLLALLLRAGGAVTLTKADLDRTDTEHNILFALSLDGLKLEVSVVSSDSGIIRSPEAKWAPNQTQSIYAAPPPPGAGEDHLQQHGLDPHAAFLPHLPQIDQTRIVQMPSPQEMRHPGTPPVPQRPAQEAAAGGAKPAGEYVFPFETGATPQLATTMSLQALQSELSKDRNLEIEENRAVAKLEGA